MRLAILTVLLLVGLGWLAGCDHHKDHDKHKKIALPIPKEPPKRPQGSPALTVKAGAAEPFSKQDVADYLKTHNLPKNATSTSDFTVDTLEFLTNKEVTTRLNGASPGLPENDKIGFATLKGLFIFTGPRQARSARFTRAYAAFDATTGNLLMIGTLEREEQPR
jgi:hypothetical protein